MAKLGSRPWYWPASFLLVAVWTPPLILAALCPLEETLHRNPSLTIKLLDGLAFCAAGTALALGIFSRLRHGLYNRLTAFADMPEKTEWVWLTLFSGGVFTLHYLQKYLQYATFQLPMDTAATVNLAHNIMTGHGFFSSLYGTSFFAFHFQPFLALYVPFLWLWNHPMSLHLLQAATTAAIPPAVYLLARRRAGPSGGIAAMLVTASSPYLFQIGGANVQAPVHLAAFFVWGIYFWETGRRWAAAVFTALALSTCEQTPFAFFGMGLYRMLGAGHTLPRARREGLWICAASAAVFLLEIAFTSSYPPELRYRDWIDMYGHLGPTPMATLTETVFHPLHFSTKIFWPPARFSSIFSVVVSTGLFVTCSPLTAVVWIFNFAPNFLAATGSLFHRGMYHYAAQVGGPVWWATAVGAAAAHDRLAARGKAAWLPIWCLAACALNLLGIHPVIISDWGAERMREAPALLSRIPPKASIWADEWLTAPLSTRSHIKALPYSARKDFELALFAPDYILFQKDWIARANTSFASSIVRFIEQEDYTGLAQSPSFILLRHPGAPLTPPGGDPPALKIAPAAHPSRTKVGRWMGAVAVEFISSKVRRSPHDAKQLALLGSALGGVGMPEESIRAFSESLALDPTDHVARMRLAALLTQTGKLGEAETHLREALRRNPADYGVHLNLGNLLEKLGRKEEAVARYHEAVRVGPRHPQARTALQRLGSGTPVK